MTNLKVSPEQAILLITERIDDIKTIKGTPYSPEYYDFIRWCSKTWSVIDGIYGPEDTHPEEIRSIGLSGCSCNAHREAQILIEVYHSRLLVYIREIQDLIATPPARQN
ncbi:MAG: hypothetical protein Q7T80_09660 [Methanoregula sp.]|nr:hypothetical protein [Methanoregula sp.]